MVFILQKLLRRGVQKGKKHGLGTLADAYGNQVSGLWENDQLITREVSGESSSPETNPSANKENKKRKQDDLYGCNTFIPSQPQ